MTYPIIEISVQDSRPVEYIEIVYGEVAYRYTTADVALGHMGHTYMPVAGARTKPESTDDPTKSACTVTIPRVDVVGDLFRVQPPSGVVGVTIYQDHYLDGDVQVVFKGRVVNAEWAGPVIKLRCESAMSSLLRSGLRRRFSDQCVHALYDQEPTSCRVNREDFTDTGVVDSWHGRIVTLTGLPVRSNGYYAGGILIWPDTTTGIPEKRMIRNSNSDGTISLTMVPFSLPIGQTVSVTAGCDHLLETCHTKFNNSDNFGGTPFVPNRNPFGGSNLY